MIVPDVKVDVVDPVEDLVVDLVEDSVEREVTVVTQLLLLPLLRIPKLSPL